MESRFPLSWPMNWPRSRFRVRSNFSTRRQVSRGEGEARHSWSEKAPLNFGRTRDELLAELARLDARQVILSTNIETRADGLPYANRRAPEDPGVAVYFDLLGKRTVLACDKWEKVEENMRAITKHIEALRGQDRWGVGTIAQAFRGYQALPETTVANEPWHEVFGVGPLAPATHVSEAYRILAKKFHPDMPGGSHNAMARLNRAKDAFERERGVKL